MDAYNIKIGVDSRSAERGVRQFSSSLNDSLKALSAFDKKAKNAFETLDKFAKLNPANMNRSVKSVAAAVDTLNKVKVSRGLINNLQTLQKALNGIRFSGGKSLSKLPEALKALDNIRINPATIAAMNGLKAAMKGFSGPPKSLANWPTTLSKLANIKLSPALAKQVEALREAMRGFVGPSRTATNWPSMLSKLANIKLPPSLATQIGALKTAMKGFVGPSKSAMNLPTFVKNLAKYKIDPSLSGGLARLKAAMTAFPSISVNVGKNLANLFAALKTANPAQINKVAQALMRLNGLNINVGRSLANISQSSRQLNGTMRDLYQTTATVSSAFHMFQAALGGVTIGSFIKSIYDTGNAFLSLQRTLGSVATSEDEVSQHMQFIDDLTQRMPISIEAATESYRKFAVAARLSGLSVKETQGIFEDFSVGFSAMGLSVESQKYAFIALEQMISKGNITMEELKTQLGDHLPGAVQILASALDVPVAKLFKMIEAGEVTADSLIKMGNDVEERFRAASQAARDSSAGQFIELGNQWTKFKKQIFNNDFNAAIGALANQLANILKTDDMQQFAARIGQAFGRAFKAIGALTQLMADNKETVVLFMKGFVAYGAIGATAGALRMLVIPLMALRTLLTPVTVALGLLGRTLVTIASVGVIGSIKKIGDAFKALSSRVMLAVTAVITLAAAMDAVFNDGRALKAFTSGIKSMVDYMGRELGAFGQNIWDGMDAGINDMSGDFDDMMKKIGEADDTVSTNIEKNRETELELLREKEKQLTSGAQKLWEEINPIGKANEAYKTQLKLLDEIAKKRGLSPEQKDGFKRILEEQSFKDRDPLGLELRTMGQEVTGLKAKTAEQKAFNDAKKFELDMLDKGVTLTAEQVKAAQSYYEAIARMNGEMGNGIERWTTTVGDFNDEVQNAIKSGIDGLSDELAGFLSGAEADFGKLAQSILKTFIKISLDGLLKDMFTSMGLNGEQNGASAAEAALAKIGSIGDTINTAMTNVYTSGLTVNGQPLTDGIPPLNAAPVIPVERRELPPIPGSKIMPADEGIRPLLSDSNDISDLKKSADKAMEDAVKRSTEKMNFLAGPHDLQGRPSLDTIDLDPMPTGAVNPAAATASPLNLGAPKNNTDFLNQMYARGRASGLPDVQARLMASQAALESGWGKSGLSTKANNFFGMKAGKSWTGETITMPTREQRADGSVYWENAKFRKYGSMEESILDKERMMKRNWPDAMNASTFEEATTGLRNGRFGAYATDVNYAGKLQSINRKIDPNAYPVPPMPVAGGMSPDPMVTGSIDKATQSLQQLGTAAQQVGTTTQSTSQTVQMANQQKTTAEQMSAMATQQAGLSAQMSSPQFQQAGQSIASAGQQAAAGAQAAQGSLGQLGSLVGAIPGIGPWGGIASTLLGMFKEGGYSDSPVQKMRIPHFDEGTPNTSGGMPAILHENEAVIPLSRGRRVPVEINSTNENDSGRDTFDSRRDPRGPGKLELHLHGVKNGDDFKRSRRQIQSSMADAMKRSAERMN